MDYLLRTQMKILAIWEGMGGVEYHRLYTPLKRLQIDHDVTVEITQHFTRDGLPALKNYDLVIYNRYLGDLHYDILQELAKQKIPYIVDIDDFWVLPKFHPTYKWYRKNKVKQAIIDGMRYANGVTCTTETLAAQIRAINPNVCILPNALDLTDEQWLQQPMKTDGVIRFGWVGGLTHANDIEIIAPAIARICDEYGDAVQFNLCGYMPNNYIWDSILYKFNGYNGQLRPQVKVSYAMPPNEYGYFYRLFDCALAPLEDTKWNACKSELKIVEAAAYGLPVLASRVLPYTNHSDNKGVRLVGNTPDMWYHAMKDYIENGKDGNPNKAYCDTRHNLEKINWKRIDFYRCKSGINAHL